MRLNKYLARSGLASRRQCDKFIESGKIKINGIIIKDFSFQVKNTDVVQCENKYIEIENHLVYYILNKPKGYICSNNDERGRKTIFDLIPSKDRLFSIGRLDYDTTGIIILTNDGDVCQLLSHPSNNFSKKYYAITDKKLEKIEIEEIKKGIRIGNTIMKGIFKFLEHEKNNSYSWEITLWEGKNREIKKIFSNFKINIKYLHRYEFGGISLGHLKIGKFKKIKRSDLKKIIINKVEKK